MAMKSTPWCCEMAWMVTDPWMIERRAGLRFLHKAETALAVTYLVGLKQFDGKRSRCASRAL